MEHKVSLPRSQDPDSSPSPEPVQPSPCLPIPVLEKSIVLLSPRLHLGLPSCLFVSNLRTKTMYAPLQSPIRATFLANLTQDAIQTKISSNFFLGCVIVKKLVLRISCSKWEGVLCVGCLIGRQ